MFQKAIKQEAKLRLAIAGPSGSGKTFTALKIAKGLGGKVAFVDTEHGSASKYADLFDFDVMNMDAPFHPDRFITAIQDAQTAGYATIVLDSLSHAWTGSGGLLEVVDQIAARSQSKNTFAAWKEGTPIYNRLVDAIIQSNVHVIAAVRSKQDYVLIEKESSGGKKYMAPEKVGMAPIQRDGFEYEFDVMLNMDNDNTAVVTKTRCPELAGGVYRKPGEEVSSILSRWLTGAEKQPLTLEQAKAFVNSEGVKYGDMTSEKLAEIVRHPKAPENKKEAARLVIESKKPAFEPAGPDVGDAGDLHDMN